jgi:hypothetical protein
VTASAGRSQRARILDALARLDAVGQANAPDFPALHRGEIRVVVRP